MTPSATTVPAIAHTSAASAAERQFWVAERVAAGSPANIAFSRIRLDGRYDPDALSEAATAVHRRHEALRTAFVIEGTELVRRVLADSRPAPVMTLPSGSTADDASGALLGTRLDPDTADTLRIAAVPDAAGAELYVAAHHIVMDGLSQEIVAADLATAYGQALCGTPVKLPACPRSPAADPRGDEALAHAAHWARTLAGVTDLPGGAEEPTQAQIGAATLTQRTTAWPTQTVQRLRSTAQAHALSPFAILLTAYGAALAEAGPARDFCVAVPVTVRSSAQQDEVGCMINTVPLRLRDPLARDALTATWLAIGDAMAHAELPTTAILAACRRPRTRRMPLYQAIFAYQSWNRAIHDVGAARLSTVPVRTLGAQAEIQMQVHETPDDGIEAILQVSTVSMWSERADGVLASFRDRLDQMLGGRGETR